MYNPVATAVFMLRVKPCCSRFFRTHSNVSLKFTDVSLELSFRSKTLAFDPVKIYENDIKFIDPTSSQRMLNLLDIPEKLRISNAEVSGETLSVTWSNKQISTVDLKPYLKLDQAIEKNCWNREKFSSYSDYLRVPYTEVFSDNGLGMLLKCLNLYGVVFVEGCPVDQHATRELAQHVAFLQPTFFGDFWEFTSDGKFTDTAYTNIPLRAHTDSTYLQNSAGVQVFHCLFHEGTGGETLLVDGQNVLAQLYASKRESYEVLKKFPVNFRYWDPGNTIMQASAPVIREVPTMTLEKSERMPELLQLRYNDYDRDIHQFHLSIEEQRSFYSALKDLAKLIQDESNEVWVKLNPGTVIFIDNWRVMHGRSGFTGKRTMCGCYLDRDQWKNRARVLGS